MKADAISNRSTSGKSSKLRCLNLSFEGKDLLFKNGDVDNGRLPHGGYKDKLADDAEAKDALRLLSESNALRKKAKARQADVDKKEKEISKEMECLKEALYIDGSKKHPLGLYSWDKGKDYQRQLRDELNHMLDSDGPEANVSPQWALEAHRQPTHSGESPLLLNKFMSPSRHETKSGSTRTKGNRTSAPTSANGVQYYRPNRMHQYLSATELKDAASENEDTFRYGRPTRTTLLRARQRVGPSSNSYELRRQIEQRMEELRGSTMVTSPKEFSLVESELDGESYHSFLTGARYNRAHYLDSKSLSQYGVYMPRNNPLGCFVVGQRGELLDTTSAPPDSPRSDIEQGSSPITQRRRPTTAPGYGYGRKQQLIRVPPSPRQAWGDASCSLHITNGDHKKGEPTENGAPVIEEIRLWSPRLNVKGSKLPLKMAREGPVRFESKLPSVHGTSLSRRHKHFQELADDNSDANQPPPSPAGHVTSKDDSHFPAVKEEPVTNGKSGEEQQEIKPEHDSEPADEVAASAPLEPEEPGEATEDTGKADDEAEQEAHTEEETGELQEETAPDAPDTLVEEQVKTEQAESVSEGGAGEESAAEKAGEEETIGTGTAEEAEEQAEEDGKEDAPPQEQQQRDVSSPDKDDDQDATKAEAQGKFFLTEENLVGGAPVSGTDDTNNNNDTASQDAAEPSEEEAGETASAAAAAEVVVVEGAEKDGEGVGGTDKVRPPSSVASSKGRRTVTFSEPDEKETKEDDDGDEAGDGDDNKDGGGGGGDDNNDDDNNTPDDANDNGLNGTSGVGGAGQRREAGGGVGQGGEFEDTDAEEGQGQNEPLRVVVTHIEKSMGAPVDKEAE